MVYRIDFQNFLYYFVDYFTRDEITSCHYAIISAKVTDGHRLLNCSRLNDLYPDTETIEAYATTGDKKILEKMYMRMVNPENTTKRDKKFGSYFSSSIYKSFVKPLLDHFDIVVVCDRSENDYIDVLCKCLKEYCIEVIDLNQLFQTGHVGPIHIDRDDIYNAAVDIRRDAVREEMEIMSTTVDGRANLIKKMPFKDKVKRLKEYGIKVSKGDMKNIDSLLLEAWCNEEPITGFNEVITLK